VVAGTNDPGGEDVFTGLAVKLEVVAVAAEALTEPDPVHQARL
jgi:hypothetical protein